MVYDSRTCIGCRKPLTSKHFILKKRAIRDSSHRSWPPDAVSFCAVECFAEGIGRLLNDSTMSDWVNLISD